jgi:acyl-CoA synthetase (AMP-forming)/AMP-acid ligase II
MRLHDYLEFFAREKPDFPFAEMEGRSVSYKEANDTANRFAHALIDSGLSKGDRFAYLSKNSIEMAIMFFGASKVGVVPVPLNYRLAPREWLYIANDANTKLLFAESEFVDGIESVIDELTANIFVAVGGEHTQWNAHDDWLSADTSNPGADVSEDDQLYQMYTSGTTGLPKGAMLSQRAIDCNLTMISTVFRVDYVPRFLIVAPLYHAAASVTLMAAVHEGGTSVLQKDFIPADVVESLSSDGITNVTLVPAMIQACLVGVPDVAERNYDSLQTLTYGASPIAEETLRKAIATFKCSFVQGFGMTETTAMATAMIPEDHERALAGEAHLLKSAGRAVLGTEVKIVDENDEEMPRGEVGEVVIRGPQIMMGYWNMAEATEKALKNGWMHTGDAARMDDEGFIYIQDRIKDMIVSGGENIYPAEVESAVFEHGAIADVAVIGVPSEQWGESVLAFVVLKPGSTVTPDELFDFCRPRLAGYKIPKQIEFIEAVPRNASGKALKKDLREPYWKGIDRRVS